MVLILLCRCAPCRRGQWVADQGRCGGHVHPEDNYGT